MSKSINCILLLFFICFTSLVSAQGYKAVYFAHDSYKLTKTALSTLDEIVKKCQSKRCCIGIAAFATPIGDLEYNEELSLKRATAVRDYLEKKSVINPDCSPMFSFGEEVQYIYESIHYWDLEKVHARQRCVDIRYE